GKPRELLRQIICGKLRLILSSDQLEEIIRVLNYPRFSFTNYQKNNVISLIITIAELVEINNNLKMTRDRTDNKIIESALEGKADFIITGDKDLLVLKKYANIIIVKANDFINNCQ
ncbi:MAG: putative toxin-antitoxin system toxin component, PIN family, partial [archaeon]